MANKYFQKLKKYLPTIIKDALNVLVPYLVKLGLSAMAKEPTPQKGVQGPYKPIQIPPEHEHEDDC
jgi:hypothetical protein